MCTMPARVCAERFRGKDFSNCPSHRCGSALSDFVRMIRCYYPGVASPRDPTPSAGGTIHLSPRPGSMADLAADTVAERLRDQAACCLLLLCLTLRL